MPRRSRASIIEEWLSPDVDDMEAISSVGLLSGETREKFADTAALLADKYIVGRTVTGRQPIGRNGTHDPTASRMQLIQNVLVQKTPYPCELLGQSTNRCLLIIAGLTLGQLRILLTRIRSELGNNNREEELRELADFLEIYIPDRRVALRESK